MKERFFIFGMVFIFISVSFVSAARVPVVGGDDC